MTKRFLIATAAMGVAAIGYAAPAAAQATRTWVSGVGDDVNPCSRTAPCKTFAGAISKTAAGGEINCLDPGGFGTLTITKSISIVCDNTIGGVLASGGVGITINAADITVLLSGLDINGVGNSGVPGTTGIRILSSASVVLDRVNIYGFRNGYGIDFEPASGTGRLVLRKSTLSDNGSASTATTGGILVKPAAGASASFSATDSLIANGQNVGVRVETAASSSTVAASIANTTVVNSGIGFLFRAVSGNGTIDATVNASTIVQNASYGIVATGPGATVRVGDTTIANNNVGLLVNPGAPVSSFGDNRLAGNGTNGAFPSVTPKQ